MIEALKNTYFKKIWEEVNWKVRHPKAKSLEEALVWESNINEALVATGDGTIYRCKDVEFCEENPYLVGINPKNNIKIKNEYNREGGYQCIILGRPITLEDILSLKEYDNLQSCISDGEMGFFVTGRSAINIIDLFDWTLTKPLHEQDENTWENIYEIINE